MRSIAVEQVGQLAGLAPDLIELQLALAERNESRGAFNRAQRYPSVDE